MFFFGKRKREEENAPVVAAVIINPVDSEIFRDLLKKEGIPFVIHNEGAGAYLKLLSGPAAAADYILVAPENECRAREIYKAYISVNEEAEIEYFEED